MAKKWQKFKYHETMSSFKDLIIAGPETNNIAHGGASSLDIEGAYFYSTEFELVQHASQRYERVS